MFALLAAAGDGGAALMPWLVGVIADQGHAIWTTWIGSLLGPDPGLQAFGLKAAYLATALCPLLMIPVVFGALR